MEEQLNKDIIDNSLSEETISFIKKCYTFLKQKNQGSWAFIDLPNLAWNSKMHIKNKELYFSIVHDAIAFELVKYEEILALTDFSNNFFDFYSKFVKKINTSHEYNNFLEERIKTLENRFGIVWKNQEEEFLKIISEDEIILGTGQFLINKEYSFVSESKDKKKKIIQNSKNKEFIITRKKGDSFMYYCKELDILFLLYSVNNKINIYSFKEEHYSKYFPILVKKGDNFGFGDIRNNLLIEGDNYYALELLQFTHKGQVDIIYIDPPYNTGNSDFKYNDSFVSNDDGSRHSKWLSFMEKRLILAKELLTDNGIIFISIDENEYGRLKLLCDNIFDENNLLSVEHIKVRSDDKSLNEKNDFQPLIEYVLIYSRNKKNFSANRPSEDYSIDKFIFEIQETAPGIKFKVNDKNITVFKKGEWKQIKNPIASLKYLKETWISGSIYSDTGHGKTYQNIVEPRINVDGLGCIYKVEGLGEDGLGYRYFSGPQKTGATRGKMFTGVPTNRVNELNEGNALKYKPIINYYDYSPDFGNISHEGGISFNKGKKPIKMLKHLFNYHKNKNSIILDFFAGSGSSAHAVLELNKEDLGNRKFIICTNNESNICEDITYKRMVNIYQENFGLEYLQIKHISELSLQNADDVGNFEYIKHINNIKFGSTKTIQENESIYLTDKYSVFKKSTKNKKQEYQDYFDLSIKNNIINLIFISSDKIEYDYFKKIISDHISSLSSNVLFDKIKIYQMSKNYMEHMLSIINSDKDIEVEKFMNDIELQDGE